MLLVSSMTSGREIDDLLSQRKMSMQPDGNNWRRPYSQESTRFYLIFCNPNYFFSVFNPLQSYSLLFGHLSVYRSLFISFDFTWLYNIPISQLHSHLLIHILMFNNCANCYMFQAQGLRRCVEEIIFSYTYPRLDMEVKGNSSVLCVCSIKTIQGCSHS
jgi:hypothetical protein